MLTNIKECTLKAFAVIGLVRKDGGMYDSNIALWQELNQRGDDLQDLAKVDEDGDVVGAWGLLNNDTLSFRPIKNPKTKILYMAGMEVADDAKAPAGFAKWVVPASDYLYAPVEENKLTTLGHILTYAQDHDWQPNGYPYDFMSASGEQMYVFLPVKKA